MTTNPAGTVSEVINAAVDAAHGGWKAPEFWTSLAALVASVTAVAWPGVAILVKAVVAGVGATVVAAYALAGHATRRTVAKTALQQLTTANTPAPASSVWPGRPAGYAEPGGPGRLMGTAAVLIMVLLGIVLATNIAKGTGWAWIRAKLLNKPAGQ